VLRIFERLRRETATAAGLREMLAGVENDLPAAQARLAAATAARVELLLTGTDAEVVEAEAGIASARIAVERLEAAQAELISRISATEHAEAHAKVQAEIDAIEARAASFGAKMPTRYDTLAAPLVALLEEQVEIDAEVRRVNAVIREAQRDGVIGSRPFIASIDERANDLRNSFRETRFEAVTSIRAGQRQRGWGWGRKL